MEEPVNQEASVQAAEDRTMDLIFPELKAHLSYLNDVYNLAFHVQTNLDGRRIADIPHQARAQYMILMRATDFVRCVQLLCVKGYPEQAGTLAASVFELAHTALFLERDAAKSSVWLNARSIEDQMPKGVLCMISRNGPARYRINGPTLHGLPAEPWFESSTRPFSLRQVFWL